MKDKVGFEVLKLGPLWTLTPVDFQSQAVQLVSSLDCQLLAVA